ncbi:hypothetical protein [Pseudomonas simiae]|uniref:hypothetical protein n=1 Tax=Pseudomonas simiae TaxID=321846 RepID=UPI000ADA6E16|nr:hypothetical protein [Pseudomonas simiae]
MAMWVKIAIMTMEEMMKIFLEFFLVFGTACLVVIAGKLYFVKAKKKLVMGDVEPLNSFLIIFSAIIFATLIVVSFLNFDRFNIYIPTDVGQVGDFVGGLTNPVLSFLALLVLLRTTLIQTNEARKTTAFMARQQDIMEREKFESTFYQLLDRLDNYCELHLRVKDSVTKIEEGKKIGMSLFSKSSQFNQLSVREQIKAGKAHVEPICDDDTFHAFVNRAMRVLRFINNSDLPIGWRRSYAALFKDTLYPHERIMLSNYCFFNIRYARRLLRKWKFSDSLKQHCFTSVVVERYYKEISFPMTKKP